MAKTKKVPKRIAGVKLPKSLRRGLRDLAASQNGRAVLAEALAAAGAALDSGMARPAVAAPRKTSAKQAPKASAAAEAPRGRTADSRAATVAALEDAARSFTDTLRRRSPSEPSPQPSAPTPASAATH